MAFCGHAHRFASGEGGHGRVFQARVSDTENVHSPRSAGAPGTGRLYRAPRRRGILGGALRLLSLRSAASLCRWARRGRERGVTLLYRTVSRAIPCRKNGPAKNELVFLALGVRTIVCP